MSRILWDAICGDCRWGEPNHECASTALGIVPEVKVRDKTVLPELGR